MSAPAPTPEQVPALVIGAGPAGLAAAEALGAAGIPCVIAEALPSPARKLLMAGKSGLNLTKAEDEARFRKAYGDAAPRLAAALDGFGAQALRDWADGLGAETFAGPSGRVFPKVMKASPLLRAWLARLAGQGAALRTRWRWVGLSGDAGAPVFLFETPEGPRAIVPKAAVLALGGASWPRLGSDAAWVPLLEGAGVPVAPFRPANMGFEAAWSAPFAERSAGEPLKDVRLVVTRAGRVAAEARGECVVSGYGLEGGAVYAVAAALRGALEAGDGALALDLAPGRSAAQIAAALAKARPKDSRATRLRKAKLAGVKAGLLRECAPDAATPGALAAAAKALPVPVLRPRPLAEAISAAGGVRWDAVDDGLMLRALPGVFLAGEMLDWEAPTGGYLLTACFATGRLAGEAAARRVG
ncbi:TIGR03862 family flavoprotein [Rhodovulum sp. DZ06]|uniref:TIGR03862 family flavoprotein n=1 Tax=Rhodovulum sp. DZ06 TaxID=3425126 RepID=UPI003D34E5B6